jgi:hypothetical protein
LEPAKSHETVKIPACLKNAERRNNRVHAIQRGVDVGLVAQQDDDVRAASSGRLAALK